MTTYRIAPLWTEIREAKELPPKALGYFQARLKNRLHQLVLTEFMKLENFGFTKADIARRIHKRPEQITRLLGAPGNWTLDTVSDLLLAMGYELSAQVKKFDEAESHAVTSTWSMAAAKNVVNPTIRMVSGTTGRMVPDTPGRSFAVAGG
jgi:hypothetical protein